MLVAGLWETLGSHVEFITTFVGLPHLVANAWRCELALNVVQASGFLPHFCARDLWLALEIPRLWELVAIPFTSAPESQCYQRAARQSGCALLESSSLLCCTISQVCLITSTVEGGCIGKEIHYYHCYSALVISLAWLQIHNPPCCCFFVCFKGRMFYYHDPYAWHIKGKAWINVCRMQFSYIEKLCESYDLAFCRHVVWIQLSWNERFEP